MRQEFEMTQEEMDEIIHINKSTYSPVMRVGGADFSNNLAAAVNSYWQVLGDKYGFEWDTVEGSSKGKLFFIAKAKPKVVPKTPIEIEMDKYDTLPKIIKHLEDLNYEAYDSGELKEDAAFLSLKRMAESKKL